MLAQRRALAAGRLRDGPCHRASVRRFLAVTRAVGHSTHAVHGSRLDGLSTTSPSEPWSLAVLGDLHLAPEQMKLFDAARGHLLSAMAPGGGRVVQLGDLGHGKHGSGSRKCFEFAKRYMDGFGLPYGMILGNHDLEGDEFETDGENLAAWKEVFGQPHFWSADLGRARIVGLSTERYRSNINCHHEVFIPPHQLQWLEGQLAAHPHTPFIVVTHAPPMGCGLKVIQEIHIKNRVAWLNHSDANPHAFIDLVNKYKNIKLWFSGHFHLSHNYPDSISSVGGTSFVQVGVIGECNRDGNRQSRLLRGDSDGYQLYTVDHDTGGLRLDLAARWVDPGAPTPLIPEEELVCDPDSGWLCSQMDCKVGDNSSGFVTWYAVGHQTILARHTNDLLIEYDMATAAPIGLVTKVPESCRIELVRSDGSSAAAEDGSDVAELRVYEASGVLREVVGRNPSGSFYKIYKPNQWAERRQKKMEKAAAVTAPAAAAAGGVAAAVVAAAVAEAEAKEPVAVLGSMVD
ncbi:hypothetical protein CHLRE_13g589870v5 [Chlamydomonas reinhardtii]|uniref:Calcineurin-like phosphoesterase domain-containing protein n=1 Tax=Chlamydomonas reinhardtii TaxID=3055 RepID=A0A2K3D103_CHLRE|nr:uncharacterized protein CHLRE_13g589870v5 [Chlamydomonas reinhardtii]PNW74215.1 hypothetical protein CHLRE_13g589870v5 [Chlamydomonas reinhardtii]